MENLNIQFFYNIFIPDLSKSGTYDGTINKNKFTFKTELNEALVISENDVVGIGYGSELVPVYVIESTKSYIKFN